MSFTDTSTANFLVGDGSNLIFPFTFALQQSADMRVYVNQVLISSGLYTVTINASGVGGNVTFNGGQAPANLAQTVLTRLVALTQATQLPREGSVPAKTLEKAYDKLTQLVQDLDARLDRTFGLSLFTTYSGSYEMQDPAASTVPQMNAGRTAVQWVSPSTLALSIDVGATRLAKLVGWRASYDHTLSVADVLTPLIVTDANATATINVKANGGTTDSLQLVQYQDGSGNVLLQDGEEIIIRAFTGHTISVVPNVAPGANQLSIILQDGLTLSLSGNKVIRLQRRGTELHELSKGGFATLDTFLLRLGGSNANTSPRPLLNKAAAPTLGTVGVAGAQARTYGVTQGDTYGTETAVTTATINTSNGTLDTNNYVTISVPNSVLGRIYKFYRTASGGTPATTGLIGTMTGTGGTITLNDTALAAGAAAPTVTTFIGPYEHVGNFTGDATMVWTRFRLYIVGDFDTGAFATTGSVELLGGVQSGLPGAAALCLPQNGQGVGGGSAAIMYSTSARGAGGGANGGAGGNGANDTTGVSAKGGKAYPAEHQLCGSGGGGASAYTTAGGAGGDGAGGFYIEATGSVTFNGNVTYNGTAGGNGSATFDGGGGGGAGGTGIVRAGTTITIAGGVTLSFAGGNGGNGGAGGAYRVGGGAGAGGYFEAWAPAIVNNGTVNLTAGTAGTSTSAPLAPTAAGTGTSSIIVMPLMRRYAA